MTKEHSKTEFSDAAYKRMAAHVGIHRMASDSFELLKTLVDEELGKIVRNSIIVRDYVGRSTLMLGDVDYVIERFGQIKLPPGIYFDSTSSRGASTSDDAAFFFPKAIFERKVHSLLGAQEVRFQDDALKKMQVYIEQVLVQLLQKTAYHMITKNVSTLSSHHINDVRIILTGRC